MKAKLSFFLFCIFTLPILCAQNKNDSTFLFENFEKGIAMYKDGRSVPGFFNYDILGGKILFQNQGEVMELAQPDDFSYIKIDDRTFIHVKNDVFYERIPCEDMSLFVWWKIQIISKGKNAGYGGTSQTSASTSITTIQQLGNLYKLESSEQFDIVDKNTYYLYLDGKYKNFNSAKTFTKLFKKQGNEISEYIKEEKIDFNNLDDIKKLVGFASQFVTK